MTYRDPWPTKIEAREKRRLKQDQIERIAVHLRRLSGNLKNIQSAVKRIKELNQ